MMTKELCNFLETFINKLNYSDFRAYSKKQVISHTFQTSGLNFKFSFYFFPFMQPNTALKKGDPSIVVYWVQIQRVGFTFILTSPLKIIIESIDSNFFEYYLVGSIEH